MADLDDEWDNFNNDDLSSTDSLNDEWDNFITNDTNNSDQLFNKIDDTNNIKTAPTCGKLKISTKTKIVYLNKMIDLKDIFWKVPIINYIEMKEGILKKQIKYNFVTKEEIEEVEKILKNENNVNIDILSQINNPTGRIKFKDIRKISIGLDKNDICLKKNKTKSAFYNCFVVILRIFLEDKNEFKEIHIKIFNTGKLEIPGIQNEYVFNKVLDKVIEILQPLYEERLQYDKSKEETVLINSNFNCNYFINREVLFNTLKYDYNINCNYDPCNYPGILCRKYQYKNHQISFMIFRTGSVLIVGKCEMNIIEGIYELLKEIFIKEYNKIYVEIPKDDLENSLSKHKKKKRKKTILITNNIS